MNARERGGEERSTSGRRKEEEEERETNVQCDLLHSVLHLTPLPYNRPIRLKISTSGSLGSNDARLSLRDVLGRRRLSLTLLLLRITLDRHLQAQRTTVELLTLESLKRLLLVLLARKVDESETLGTTGGLAELAADDGRGLDRESLEDRRKRGVVDLEGEVADEEGRLGLGAGGGAATAGSAGLGRGGTVDGGSESGGSTLLTLEETVEEQEKSQIGERGKEERKKNNVPSGGLALAGLAGTGLTGTGSSGAILEGGAGELISDVGNGGGVSGLLSLVVDTGSAGATGLAL